MNRGDFQIFSTSDERIYAIKWIDNRTVDSQLLQLSRRCQLSLSPEGRKVSYLFPDVKRGNANMGGVDKHDQLVLTWYRSFYFRYGFNSFDQARLNSTIAWNAIHPDSNVSAEDFQLSAAEGIVADFSSRSRQPSSNKRKTTVAGLEKRPSVSVAAHLAVVTTRWRCVECYQRKIDLKSNVGYNFPNCNGNFCITKDRNCFLVYHSQQ